MRMRHNRRNLEQGKLCQDVILKKLPSGQLNSELGCLRDFSVSFGGFPPKREWIVLLMP